MSAKQRANADMDAVVVLGAGLMGAEIGLEYALSGYQVTLVTRTPASHARAIERVRVAADALVRSRIIRAADRATAFRNLALTSEPEAALVEADLIVESVGEDFDLKVDVLRRAARANPTATIASNTSALSITALGESVAAGDRLLGAHYWNPPTLMPLVEVVAGRSTDPERVEAMAARLRGLGKQPIIAPDIPGFLWNRLQLALIREAVSLVRDGLTSPDTIDQIARLGFGRRWALIGPFASLASGGATTVAQVADLVFPSLANADQGDDIRNLRLPSGRRLETEIAHRNRKLAQQLREDRHANHGGSPG